MQKKIASFRELEQSLSNLISEVIQRAKSLHDYFEFDKLWRTQDIHEAFLNLLLPYRENQQIAKWYAHQTLRMPENSSSLQKESMINFLAKQFSKTSKNSSIKKVEQYELKILEQNIEFSKRKNEFFSPQQNSLKQQRYSEIDLIQQPEFTISYKDSIVRGKNNLFENTFRSEEVSSLSQFIPFDKLIQSNSRVNKYQYVQEFKTDNRGRKPADLLMEHELCIWIIEKVKSKQFLSQKMIRQKAKKLSRTEKFQGSKGWLQKFFRRNPKILKIFNQGKMESEKKINFPI